MKRARTVAKCGSCVVAQGVLCFVPKEALPWFAARFGSADPPYYVKSPKMTTMNHTQSQE